MEDLERRAGTSEFPIPGAKEATASSRSSSSSTGKNGKPKKQQHTLSSLSAAAAAQQAALAAAQQQRQTSPYNQQSQHHSQQPQSVMIPPHKQSISQSQFTPPLNPEEEMLFAAQTTGAGAYETATHSSRDRSHTPPSMFTTASAYSYPAPEDVMMGTTSSSSSRSTTATAHSSHSSHHGHHSPPQHHSPHHQHQGNYRTDASAYQYNDWAIASVPVTLPSMNHFTDGMMKRDDDAAAAAAAAAAAVTMAPYNMGYNFLSTAGIDAANPYDSNPHVSLRRSS